MSQALAQQARIDVTAASPTRPAPAWWLRWLPFATAAAVLAALLAAADTAPLDIARFAAYAAYAVVLPGTLVYRALRRRAYTFVEDLAMGAAVGLVLEIAAWAAFSALDLRSALRFWPLLIVAAFAAVPRLRRHWRPRDYAEHTGAAWSWAVAGIVIASGVYLFLAFFQPNPILPGSEQTRQYMDLAYQLSLAGEARNHLPLDLPQAANEPLYYHWFAYVHMAMANLVGGVDLVVVSLRLAVPALVAAAVVLTAVVGRRISGRPWAGVAAALLMWLIGEVNFTDPVTQPFGTFTMFVTWHGMSITHSWVLQLALIAVLADQLTPAAQARAPQLGRVGGYTLAALLAVASSGSKASVLPVTLAGLAFAGLILLITRRRIPWHIVGLGAVLAAAQLFSTAVLFRLQTYGLEIGPLANIARFWHNTGGHRSPPAQAAVIALVFTALFVNLLVKYAGAWPLLRAQRWRLEPAQLMLAGTAIAGPVLYLTFASINSQYFTRAGMTAGVLLAGWGWAELAARAELTRRCALQLTALGVAYAAALLLIQLALADPAPTGTRLSPLKPILLWTAALLAVGLLAAAGWFLLRRLRPAVRGTGALLALSAVLLAGAPGYAMDVTKTLRAPNGGPYTTIELPRSRVDAARWVREHSEPGDVLATNVHCLRQQGPVGPGDRCDPRSFWLSAYAEREVLVEGWGFAPRRFADDTIDGFWDPELLRRNHTVFTAPTAELLADLATRDGVRWLVVDTEVAPAPPNLAALADLRFDNGRLQVYQLR